MTTRRPRYTMPPPGVSPDRPHLRREAHPHGGSLWVVWWTPTFPHHVARVLECVQRLQARNLAVTVRYGDPR